METWRKMFLAKISLHYFSSNILMWYSLIFPTNMNLINQILFHRDQFKICFQCPAFHLLNKVVKAVVGRSSTQWTGRTRHVPFAWRTLNWVLSFVPHQHPLIVVLQWGVCRCTSSPETNRSLSCMLMNISMHEITSGSTEESTKITAAIISHRWFAKKNCIWRIREV